jgi:hypothetical protein
MKLLITGTKRAAADDSYVYDITCEAITGTEKNIFCIRTMENTYAHVATFYDLNTYPTDRATAASTGKLYYRSDVMTIEFASLAVAMEFEEYLLNIVRQLVFDVNRVQQVQFPGSFSILVE